MPKRDDSYMANRREEILGAAQACLEQMGLDKFTIEEICREAGISTGALYRHFPTKRDILIGLLDRSARLRDSAEIDTLPELEGFLVGVFERHDAPGGAELAQANFKLLQMCLADPEMLAKAQESIAGIENFLAQALRRIAAKKGLSPAADIGLAAKRIANLVRGVWLAKAIDPERPAARYIDCIKSEIALLR